MADAGKVLIITKGSYDANVAYEILDLVKHNDVAWLAKKPCIGVEPSEENSEYWFELLTTDATKLGGETAEDWQTKIDAKANASHGTHVNFTTTAPVVAGTASVGSATTVSRSDHVHPAQTSVSGNAGTATKLATARTIELTGDVTGSATFDGSGNVSITATVANSSHSHAASNITAGTMAGKVLANATAVATLGNKQVRNIYAGTSSMTAGTTALPSGDIYIKYK